MRLAALVLLVLALVPTGAQAQRHETRTDRARQSRDALTVAMDQAGSRAEAEQILSDWADTQMRIRYAESAGPYELASAATVLDPMTNEVLRQGTNGWTCLPLVGAPMCLDQEWMKWWQAVQSGTAPEITKIGLAYMLAGDNGGPNTAPTDGREGPTMHNDWVIVGPHVMVLSPDPALLDALPSDPRVGGPFVMWRGSPLAHVMMPIYEGSVTVPYQAGDEEAASDGRNDGESD